MAENVVPKKTTKKVVRRTTTRKAPTRVSSVPASSQKNIVTFVAIGIFLVLVGVSVAIGYSDKGRIDVSQTISEKKSSGTPEEQEKLRNVPVQQQKTTEVDGGLVPTTDIDKSTVQKKIKEETGTSTDATASSTDATASSTEESIPEEVTTEEEVVEEVTE